MMTEQGEVEQETRVLAIKAICKRCTLKACPYLWSQSMISQVCPRLRTMLGESHE